MEIHILVYGNYEITIMFLIFVVYAIGMLSVKGTYDKLSMIQIFHTSR